jgi:hypothetical protein
MKTMITPPMIGSEARMTNAIFHLTAIAIAAPQTNIANKLNMLPIF